MDRWKLEPIDSDVYGWAIVDNFSKDEDEDNTISVVIINEDLEYSKNNAALISTAPELLAACKKALMYIDKESSIYSELTLAINKSEGLDGDLESLNYFDNMADELGEDVIVFDLEKNNCSYSSSKKMKDLFSFQSFYENVGLLNLNASIVQEDVDYEIEYDLRYPIAQLLSRETYNEFIAHISDKYINIKEFMEVFENEHDNFSLRDFIGDEFYDKFATRYETEMNLDTYLKNYPLFVDNEELQLTLPKFLEKSPHTLHINIEVNYNGTSVEGIIFYRKNEDKYFIYNQDKKSVSFIVIPNKEEEKIKTTLKFTDLIQKVM